MRRTLASIGITVACLASLTVAGGRPESVDPGPLGEAFDSRTGAPGIGPTRTQVSAIIALLREHPDVRVDWNTRFGTPATVLRHGAVLAGPSAGTPAAAAKAWLLSHAALFGWNAGAIPALRVIKTLTQPNGGPVIVLLHQTFAGYEGYSFGGSVVVGLDRANRVLSVRTNVVRIPALAKGSRRSAADALRIASGWAPTAIVGTRNGWIEFSRGATPAPHFVRRIAFPIGTGPARPAWEVHLTKRLDSRYRVVVDAATGKVLYRHQMALRETPEGRVFQNYPGAKRGGEHEMASFAGDPTASPEGWLTPGAPATTFGNNAVTATHWIAGQAPEGLGQVRPVSAGGSFDPTFQDAWNSSECGGSLPAHGPGATPTYALDAEAAVLNLFYHHNVMHDYFYGLGFDEKAGAMQLDNFGRGGKGNDPLHGLTQAGASVLALNSNNAYMSPAEDGLPQYSGMFLFLPVPGAPFPCVDGDFDTNIIYHEYTHGVSSRWVGGEYGNLDTFQGGSMGESWSDFYATHYLFQRGLETNAAVGIYATGDVQRGIRNWPMSAVEANYGDIGYDGAPEVHSDGEIWNGVLWDIRTSLAKVRANGAELAAQLIADAMPLSGPSPSMLDMRDAILAADVARTEGANQSLLWTVFARHGMGFSAKTKDGDDIDPVPAFDHKDATRNATVIGRVVDPVTNAPLPFAAVTMSRFEQAVTPVTTTSADGTFRIRLAAGVHSLKITLPGYGAQLVSVTAKPGKTISGVFSVGSNYASARLGAKVISSSGGKASDAIDESESSAWTSTSSSGPKAITIKLAGDRPVSLTKFRLSALTPDRGTAAKAWSLSTSLDGKTFTDVARGSFGAGRLGPAVNDLAFIEKKLSRSVTAAYVRIVVSSAQDSEETRFSIADLQVFGAGDGFKAKVVEHDRFFGEGTVTVPGTSLLYPSSVNDLSFSPTAIIFEGTCVYPPPTQGLDGFVMELPASVGDGAHRFTLTAKKILPADPAGTDVDIYFYSEDCERIGQSFVEVNPESGTVPAGARYALVVLWVTGPTDFVFEAVGAPIALTHVGVPKKPLPRVEGRKRLPATGIERLWVPGLAALLLAGGLAFRLRRHAR